MKHLAVIMDGNGRYAVSRGLDRKDGHRIGAEVLVRALRDFISMPIDILSVYAFSLDNNKRPKEEVSNIMKVIAYFLQNEVYPLAKSTGMSVRFIGDTESLDENLKTVICNAPQFFEGKVVIIAINYGGCDEICRAVRRLNQKKEAVNEASLKNSLDTAGYPNPDAVLRFGGYKRLSNFMPIQTAYSELFFTDKLWPEYEKEDFIKVIEDYKSIKRNFGGIDA